MNNIVLCDPFYAYIKVGEQYLKLEKWCKANNINKTKFRGICKNQYVRLVILGYSDDIFKFAADENYKVIELYHSSKLNEYKNGLQILYKYMK